MSSWSNSENGAKPWSPSGPGELVLDGVTLGYTRLRRARRTREHFAMLDEQRLAGNPELARRATPRPLPNLKPGDKVGKIAQLALEIASTAQVVHINTFQGFTGTSTLESTGARSTNSNFGGTLHEPTLLRVKEATRKDYVRDLRSGHAIVALVTRSDDSVDIEGIGRVANEYTSPDSQTGRITDATFLVQGLEYSTAQQFARSLQRHPTSTLDGVMYTAFRDGEVPGHSGLQVPIEGQPADSLIPTGVCTGVGVFVGSRLQY
jgi:hypothetical protein